MLRLVLISLAIASASAIVCAPDICSRLLCAAVTAENCAGKIVYKGGFCGCCDACVNTLAEGSSCVQDLLLGAPASATCDDGLVCDTFTITCQDPANIHGVVNVLINTGTTSTLSCAQQLLEIQAASANGMPLLGLLGQPVPTCAADGSYAPHQCEGSVCYCVDRYGNRILGYSANINQSANMDCQCARDQYTFMQAGWIGRLFTCTQSGSYVPHQCEGSVCYCVDPYGNRILNYSINISQSANMDCQCAHDQYAYMQTGLIGRLFTCTQSGSYAPHQCEGSVCYCVDPYGNRIPDYSVNIGQSANMDCKCARDQYAYIQTGFIGHLFMCNKAGSYQRYACTGSVCYCVDNLGNKLAGSPTVNIGNIRALHC